MEKPSFYSSQTREVSARVESINHESRLVTLLRADGERITFTASDDVRNLDHERCLPVGAIGYQGIVCIELLVDAGCGSVGIEVGEGGQEGPKSAESLLEPSHRSVGPSPRPTETCVCEYGAGVDFDLFDPDDTNA